MIPFNDAVRAQHATCEPITLEVSTVLPGGGGEGYIFGRDFGSTRDRIVALDISASLDDSVAHLSVTLERGLGAESLSLLQADSTVRDSLGRHFLSPGNRVDLHVRAEGDGLTDEHRIFTARLDSANPGAGPNQVVLNCRDFGAWLLKPIPEATKQGGTDAKGVMDNLINTFTPLDASDVLIEPVPSDFFVEYYAQQEMTVLEACRIIAQQIGWDFRWFEYGLSGLSRLHFYDPGRFRLLVDYEFTEDMYTRITDATVDDADQRNRWQVYWQDADGAVQGPVEAKSDDWTPENDLFARIYLDRATNIRSTEAAQRYADAALADTKDPLVSVAIEGMCFPGIELNDWVRFRSTDQWSDAPQGGDVPTTGNIDLAVSSYSHRYADGHWTTTIGGRASPIAAFRDYRRSVPPKTIATIIEDDPTYYAPEGTVVLQTENLDFP